MSSPVSNEPASDIFGRIGFHSGLFMISGSGNGKEKPQLLGHLFCHNGNAYEPSMGLIPNIQSLAFGGTLAEICDRHNSLLDTALIEGLDRCRIGQSGMFYLTWKPGLEHGSRVLTVSSYTGRIVSQEVVIAGRYVTFFYHAMKFKGAKPSEGEAFSFKRIQ